jgi:hypothetical protein
VSPVHLITPEQIAAPFVAGGWEDRTVDPDDESKFRLPTSDGIALLVGVGATVRAGDMSFSPSIGVQHNGTSRLVAEFLGRQPGAGQNLSSTGVVLAEVLNKHGIPMAPYRRWRITSPQEAQSLAEVIYADVIQYGVPEFSEIRSLDELIDRLQAQKRYQALSGHLAVACGIAGRRGQAESSLREYADASRGQQGPMLQQSQGFLARFAEHFGFGSEYLIK